MPKIAPELTALAVSRLKTPGLYAVGGVAGLHLQVTDTGAKSWILRTTFGYRTRVRPDGTEIRVPHRRDVGLGGYPTVQLAEARTKAREARAKVEQGVDPIAERKRIRSALSAEISKALTFSQACTRYIDAHGDAWKSAKHRGQWESTLRSYADPIIGKLHVADVTQAHVLQILQPIWKTKTETATRLRGRIEQVLDWAITSGYREGPNPAQWRSRLDKLLAKPSKIAKVEHHTALPIDEMHGFMVELAKREGNAARALELLVLTATRSGEVRGARWPEFDLDAAIWCIPPERMKMGIEHRVPLSPQAVALLKSMPRFDGTDLVFPGQKNQMLSDMALSAVLRRMFPREVNDTRPRPVPHGLRSTFRDWAAERTNFPREVAEQALAHAIGNQVEAAYRRGDLLAKRARLMSAWASFIETPTAKGSVTPISKRA